MGGILFRNSLDIQDKTSLPTEMDFLQRKLINSEFNKLYLTSRDELHAITDNPSEEVLMNISQCLKQNSKFLSNCFKEASANQYDIVDLVTDRLVFQGIDYKVPSTEPKHVDKYLKSNGNSTNEKQQQP